MQLFLKFQKNLASLLFFKNIFSRSSSYIQNKTRSLRIATICCSIMLSLPLVQINDKPALAAEIIPSEAQTLLHTIQENNKNCDLDNGGCKKYNLIYVFASWCHYCSNKVPALLKMSKTYAKNLNIYFISLDESASELKHFAGLLPDNLKIFVLPPNQTYNFFTQLNLNFRYNIPSFALLDTKNNVVVNMVNSLNKIDDVLKKEAE